MSNLKNSNNKQVLFIANRGEICRRIIKSANMLGIDTVVPLLPEHKNTKKTLPYYAKEAKSITYYNSNDPLKSYLNIKFMPIKLHMPYHIPKFGL